MTKMGTMTENERGGGDDRAGTIVEEGTMIEMEGGWVGGVSE